MTDQPQRKTLAREIAGAWQVLLRKGPSQIQFWFIALALGIASGLAAVGFAQSIRWLQSRVYQTDDLEHLHVQIAHLDWYWVVLIPLLGGLVVGLILDRWTSTGRVQSVADVIEAAALHEGRLKPKRGIVSTLASLITLSTGGSSGREGPVVHLAGILASMVSRSLKADGITGRDLLGCAVAAAVSASFNAPIAGALFALEVVLRHFAVHAFAPIVVASVAGTVVGRLLQGDVTEFTLSAQTALSFYIELPAFVLLGLVCGLTAVILIRSLYWAEEIASDFQARFSIPRALRPAIAGGLLGIMAIWFPHIIGVGYGTTSRALTGDLTLGMALIFVVVKVIAVAVTFGGRMGGGVFSPSLMIGALTGLAFGLIATSVVPQYSGSGTIYALAGMGAVAAAVLGAPISTTLIVFELTGDWQTGLAVMVAVSISSALATRMIERSYFLGVLERRGLHLAAGPQDYLVSTLRAETYMRAAQHPRAANEEDCWRLIGEGTYVDRAATLEQAMPIFERSNAAFIPVVRLRGEGEGPELWGALFHIDALKAINRALAATAAEEHS